MATRHVQLIDSHRSVVASAQIAETGNHYEGTIDLRITPPEILAVFEEFEEIVNGQMFAFLDEIQERIAALALKVVFDDGAEADIQDLQVFAHAGDVSLRLDGVPSSAVSVAIPAATRLRDD
jgi:hypothetical protein